MDYNILATLRAALVSVHGVGKIESALSDFSAIDELQGRYRGMVIAIPSAHWNALRKMALLDLAALLKDLAAQVDLKRFLKQPRKKKPLVAAHKQPYASTDKLLES